MPSTTQGAISTVSSTLRNAGGANILASISSNDGDTSYGHSLSGETRSGTFGPSQLPTAAASITSATNYNQSKEDGPGGTGVTQNWDGDSWSTGQSLTTGYANKSDAHDSARLTVAYMNSDYLGVRQVTGGGRGIRTTYIYRNTNWEYGGGGGVWLLCEVLLPVLGTISGLALSMMPALARMAWEIQHRETWPRHIGQTWIRPDEYQFHYDAWQEYTYPRQFDLAVC
jgi:hypothetical protein